MHGLHPLNFDADVLEMAKYVKDYKIILVYVEHRSSNVDSSIFVSPKNGVAITIDNHLTKALIEIDSSPDVNKNLTPMFVVENVDPFEDLDKILEDYENTRDEITGKQMVLHVGNSSTVDDVLDLHMLFKTERVGPIGIYDSEDLDYDPKHDEVFDDDEHIVKDVPMSMNDFNFTPDPQNDLSIGVVEVQEHDLDVIDYDSFGSDLDDGIDSKRRIQLRELRRIGKQKTRMGDHVIKTLATNPDIPVRAVHDQMQKQFDVGVSKMTGFRAKRIATNKIVRFMENC
ncbi:hypothetical protein Tco_0309436 [Tanacetum coccineum]